MNFHRQWKFSLKMTSRVESTYDVVVIGSGIAGLSCAAILANQGMKVAVAESHYELGGCAHEFIYTKEGKNIPSTELSTGNMNNVYRFEAGPSLYSGLSTETSPNPLKHVIQIIGEEPQWIQYNIWKAFLPEVPLGFQQSIGAAPFEEILRMYGGPNVIDEWRLLTKELRPLTKGVMSFPSAAMRPDLGAIRTALFKYPSAIIDLIKNGRELISPFSNYYDKLQIKDKFLKNYLNLLCFLLQGLPATGTSSAVMSYMIEDFFRPNAVMDYPIGGSGAIISALARGVEKYPGCHILRRSHVEEILITDNKASGVRLRNNKIIKAKKAVVSNCDLWSTFNLVPSGVHEKFDIERRNLLTETPMCKSFMHLHLGIDGLNLPVDMPPQWTVCNSWDEPIDSASNVIVVSMPSLLDPSLAPPGHHVIHAYTAGNEPYDLWKQFKNSRGSAEYLNFKNQRVACLWKAIERQIPDIKSRVKVELVGTPLTHERFNRRYSGTYGPAIEAGSNILFPGQTTPIEGLFRCGDSTNPGIGVPAVAASGSLAAAAILSVKEHLSILNRIKM